MKESSKNLLYYGDNLDVMRLHIKDETVDLVYLDPPFNSNTNYNVLFAEKDGSKAASQIQAFSDTWIWNQESESVFAEIVMAGGRVADCLQAFRTLLGECDMLAYLVMMAPRLVELRRVMKPSASIYLHCDTAASHYLKMLMDAIFCPENFRNEIIWRRTTAGKPVSRSLPKNTDSIFWYTKTDKYYFQPLVQPLTVDAMGRKWYPPKTGWRFNEERMHQLEQENRLVFGKTTIREKYYLSERETKGKQLSNLWIDIPIVF